MPAFCREKFFILALILPCLLTACSGEKPNEELPNTGSKMCEQGRSDNRLDCLTSREDALHAQNKGDFSLIIENPFTNKSDYTVTWAELAGSYKVTYLQASAPDCLTPATGFTPVTGITDAFTTASFATDGDYYLCIFAESEGYETIIGKNNGFKMTLDTIVPSAPTVEGLGVTNDAALEWSWTTTDETGNGKYRININNDLFTEDTDQTTNTSYKAETLFSDGIYTIFVQAGDEAGNWSESGSFQTILDTTQPGVSLIELPPPTDPTQLQILVRFNETTSGFEKSDLTIENAKIIDLTGDGIEYELTLEPTGAAVSITVNAASCNDSAGNTNTPSDTLVVAFEITP